MPVQNYNKTWKIKLLKTKSKIWADGTYPVCVVIRKEGKRKVISLGISAHPHQWDDERQIYQIDKRIHNLHPERFVNNEFLEDRIKPKCRDIIREFEKRNIDWTLNQFEDAFRNRLRKVGVERYFIEHISDLNKKSRTGTAKQYYYTLILLQKFDKSFSRRLFPEIDYRYVRRFNDWLQIERGVGAATVKYYMKALRALVNKAIKEGDAPESTYPFGKGKYSISALDQETLKRYLPSEYIDRIKTFESENLKLILAKNLFLFSYYCQGMAFADMANLTASNIFMNEDGRYIVYKRYKLINQAKTRPIHIKITGNIDNILAWFRDNTNLVSPYILPIISVRDKEGAELYYHIRNRLKKYNFWLNRLGKELGFEGIKLTSYVSRHSYAMRLKNAGIPEDVISEALGHKELSTTKVYLDSFQNNEVSKANEVL